MPLWFAPVLAQLVTVGLTDRTEARYVTPYPYNYEASTTPGVRLSTRWPRWEASVGYAPSLTLARLESTPRDLLVNHRAFASASHRLRRTSFTLGTNVTYGDVNFRTGALAPSTPQSDTAAIDGRNPNPPAQANPGSPNPGSPTPGSGMPVGTPAPGATPTPGSPTTPLQPALGIGAVRYGSWSTSLAIGHQVNRRFTLTGTMAYTVAGALEAERRVEYPLTRGTVVGAIGTYVYPWTKRDSLVTTVTVQQAWSTLNSITSVLATELWHHRFAERTVGSLGAGISLTRTPLYDIYLLYTVYPTFTALLSHTERIGEGMLTVAGGIFSAPTLDPLRATVDPRIGVTGSVTWVRDRFSAAIGGGTAVSIAKRGNDAGAYNITQATAVMTYLLTDWLSADAGGRVAEQQYQGATTIPLSYSAFVGLKFGVEVPLKGSSGGAGL